MPYHQFTIKLHDRYHEALTRHLNTKGCLGVIEEEGSLIAFFPLSADRQAVATELSVMRSLLDIGGTVPDSALSFDYAVLGDQDWNIDWKKNFPPVDIGHHFSIRPPWDRHTENRIALIIDPGMAFGTGHHETTRSCLILMEKHADRVEHDRFLDIGTGTGLLAIAALKLGFRSIDGIDTDPLAIEAARGNLELNQAGAVKLIKGDISYATGRYNMIAANLISGTLVALAKEIAGLLEPRGIAILSGILKGQETEVINAMKISGLSLSDTLTDGKWITLTVTGASTSLQPS
ncbi:MAG: 50S ribosomal protein L11 methyltransferase [Nitrospirota bacterium]|nr:50S ribosomal protein L11 methyltransferase [Nitrospirota bacterium]